MRDPFFSSLMDHDGNHPERWDPQEGDVLVGTLQRYEGPISTEYGPAHIAIVLDEQSGSEVSVWLLETVLVNEFSNLAPDPGERVGIKYMGVQSPRSGTGKPYKKYVVRVDRKGDGSRNPFRQPAREGRDESGPPAHHRDDLGRPVPPSQEPHHAPAPPPSPPRDQLAELRSQWDNLMRQYRVEDWQVEALAQLHKNLRDQVSIWGEHDYREALSAFREKGPPLFYKCAEELARTQPASEEFRESVQENLEKVTDQKVKLRAREAFDTRWHDALVWAHDLILDSLRENPPSEPEQNDGPDDNLPF